MGDASLSAGDICGGVEESSEEPRGAASSESPEGRKGGEDDPLLKTNLDPNCSFGLPQKSPNSLMSTSDTTIGNLKRCFH